MRLTPSSTARLSTALDSSGSSGSPHIPSPVIRIAPNPRRFTGRSPPSSKVSVLILSDISGPFGSCILPIDDSTTAALRATLVSLAARWAEAEDAVSVGDRVATTVAVVGEDPQRTIRSLLYVPQTPGLAPQELLALYHVAPLVKVKAEEALSAQARHEEISLPLWNRAVDQDLRTARGGLAGRRPGGDGVGIPGLAALTLDVGPAIIAALLDPVYLIVDVLPE